MTAARDALPAPVLDAGVPRIRLSLSAFAAATGVEETADADTVEELVRDGAAVRRSDGALVVDPALQAALRVWAGPPVAVDAVRRAGRWSVHVEVSVDPPLAVGVVRARRDGADLDAVDVCVPGVGGVVREVLGQVGGGGNVVAPGDAVWLRVRGPGRTWLGHHGPGPLDVAGLRSDLTAALVSALDRIADGSASWR